MLPLHIRRPRKTELVKQRVEPGNERLVTCPHPGADPRRGAHAYCDRLTVEIAITRGLDRVAKGVSKVQEGPRARLSLVLRDHGGLQGHVPMDAIRGCRFLKITETSDIALQKRHQISPLTPRRRGLDDGMLDHFRPTGGEVPDGQRAEKLRIDNDQRWLIKSPDQILANLMVDAGLAADAAVHHGQQAGRDLDQSKTAETGGRDEPGEVSDHPASQRHDHVPTLHAAPQQPVIQIADDPQTLAALAGWNPPAADIESADDEPGLNTLLMQSANPLVCHDQGAPRPRPALSCQTTDRAGSPQPDKDGRCAGRRLEDEVGGFWRILKVKQFLDLVHDLLRAHHVHDERHVRPVVGLLPAAL